ncbi:MAG: rod shape-determining protein [Oscillospiraceae bacterium]|jgi:rod shape-determining protein MreB|nr:rod shape-determining protein [Oscillospiraceae bacterium]
MLGVNDIGVDLGTATVLIYMKNKGILLREPAMVAIDKNTRNPLAWGEKAYMMLGRTPANIAVIRPLADGSIVDYDTAERMLRYFLRRVLGKRMVFRPRVVASLPAAVTEVEKSSMVDAILSVGARKAQLIDESVAAAIGAGLDVQKAYGSMVVNIGGGITGLAVLAMGRCVVSDATTKATGDRMSEAIIRYLRRKHNLMIGERSAEMLKINIGAAQPRKDVLYMEVTGRNLLTGLPKTIAVSSTEMADAMDETIQTLVESMQAMLERTPPELVTDIFDRGIVLTGGGSQLFGLDKLLSDQLRVDCRVADDPVASVVLGIGMILEEIETHGKLLLEGGARTGR